MSHEVKPESNDIVDWEAAKRTGIQAYACDISARSDLFFQSGNVAQVDLLDYWLSMLLDCQRRSS